ncbi:hypothetical protein ACFQ10_09755 [Streptomyces indonesiensis]
MFHRYDEARLDRDYRNFNRGDVLLKERSEEVVDVRVELDADSLPEDEGPGSCRVEVVHRDYTGLDRVKGTERVAPVLKGAGRKGRPCELATDLAGSAAAALPPA